MKKFKKFLLYVGGFLVVAYLIIASVDYPDEHSRKVAEERASLPLAPITIKTQPDSDAEPQRTSFSDDVRGLGDAFEEFVATIRQLKQGFKSARCGGKMIFQLWQIDMRLDDVPDEIAYEAFLASGIRVQQLDIISMDREEITDEQLDADYSERLTELYRRFEEQPSEYQAHQILDLCRDNKHNKFSYQCSDSQLNALRENLSDSLQGWLMHLEVHDQNDLTRVGDFIDMAIGAPVDQALRRETFQRQFQLVESVTNNRNLAMIASRDMSNFTARGSAAINRFCSSVVRDVRCIQLADRLAAEATNPWQRTTAQQIKRRYYEAEGDTEALAALNTENQSWKARGHDMPLFSDEYIDYALEVIPQHDHVTVEDLLSAKANELLLQDPDTCTL